MTALFISDLHIDAARPAIVAQFLRFLQTEAKDAAALYILGDLFESWIGDDAPDDAQTAAIAGLRTLTASGVACFVMHGNRDFLLARRFCEMSGAQMLHDPLIITLYGEAVLVMHGDALCTDDHAYQRLRATVRDSRLAASVPGAVDRIAPRACRRGPRRQSSAYCNDGASHHGRECGQRCDGTCASPEPRLFCTAIRIGPPFMPWKWMDGLAPASS